MPTLSLRRNKNKSKNATNNDTISCKSQAAATSATETAQAEPQFRLASQSAFYSGKNSGSWGHDCKDDISNVSPSGGPWRSPTSVTQDPSSSKLLSLKGKLSGMRMKDESTRSKLSIRKNDMVSLDRLVSENWVEFVGGGVVSEAETPIVSNCPSINRSCRPSLKLSVVPGESDSTLETANTSVSSCFRDDEYRIDDLGSSLDYISLLLSQEEKDDRGTNVTDNAVDDSHTLQLCRERVRNTHILACSLPAVTGDLSFTFQYHLPHDKRMREDDIMSELNYFMDGEYEELFPDNKTNVSNSVVTDNPPPKGYWGDLSGGDLICEGLEDWERLSSRAKQCRREKEYQQCIYIYSALIQFFLNRVSDKSHATVGTLLHNLALVHIWNGQYEDAYRYASEAVKVRKKTLGTSHIDVASSLSELGISLYALSSFAPSISSFREALQITCKSHGYTHPTVASILNNIACVHFEKSNYSASISTFYESIDIQRGAMGAMTDGSTTNGLLNVAMTLNNIGMCWIRGDDVEKGAEMLEEALMVQESVLGEENEVVECTKINLERMMHSSLSSCGSRSSSSSQLVGLAIAPSTPPHSHQNTIITQSDTNGTAIISPINKINPIALFGETDGIPKRRSPSRDHINTHAIYNDNINNPTTFFDGIDVISLGSLRIEYTANQRIRNSILAGFRLTPPESASSIINPPFIGRPDLQQPVMQHQSSGFPIPNVPATSPRIRMMSSLKFDLDDDSVVDAELHLNDLYDAVVSYLERNEIKEALDLFQCSCRSHENKYGKNHHLVGTTLHNMGVVHLYAENYIDALPFFQRAVKVRRSALGHEHPDVAVSMIKIGVVQFALQQFDAALSSFCDSLSLRRKVLGYSHPQVAKILNNIGAVHYEHGGLLAALKAFEEALEIQRKEMSIITATIQNRKTTLGRHHHHHSTKAPPVLDPLGDTKGVTLDLASTLSNIGFIYVKRKEYAEAIVTLEEALQLQRSIFTGERSAVVELTLENLAYAMAYANSMNGAMGMDNGSATLDETQGIKKLIEMYREMLWA